MRLSAILLFLHLWGNVQVSFSLNACSTLPDVPHALVSGETKKDEYQEGDVTDFPCEPGYTSSQTSKYVCTSGGWVAVQRGSCYSCSTLPDVPHAFVSIETKKDEYQEGDVIDFICHRGYTSSQTSKYVCTSGGWLAIRQGTCYSLTSSCAPPPARSFTVNGLPEIGKPISPGHIITVSCDGPGKSLNGSSVLICGEDGQWNTPFPSCIDTSCKVHMMHDHLIAIGPQQVDQTVKIGHRLQFQCSDNFLLEGPGEIECLEAGQWNASFPTCVGICEVGAIPRNVRMIPSSQGHRVRMGEKLYFGCVSSREYLRGNAEVECSPSGQWSGPFPTCGGPLGCGRPPALEDGDTVETLKYQYRHGERVQYSCQNYYTMDGDPYRTCSNGQWTGQLKCLKPCTVNSEIMDRHNIVFKYTYKEKLYARHNDDIDFMCKGGTYHDHASALRQRCVDGEISLPTCY